MTESSEVDKFYCIHCESLVRADKADQIFETGFRIEDGKQYALGICGKHLDQNLPVSND